MAWRHCTQAALALSFLFGSSVQAQELVKGDDGTGVHLLFQTNVWLAPNVHYNADGRGWTKVPGVAMEPSKVAGYSNEDGWFQYDVPSASSVEFTFTDGFDHWDSNHSKNYKVKAGTWKVFSSVIDLESQSLVKESKNEITILYRVSHWGTPRIHYNGGDSWTAKPGVEMQPSNATGRFSAKHGWYQHTIKASSAEIVFNNGNGVWDSNMDKNYRVSKAGIYAFTCQSDKRDDGYVTSDGYKVTNVAESGRSIVLSLALNSDSVTPYGKDIKELTVEVSQAQADTVQIKISDKNNARWEVPTSLFPKGALGGKVSGSSGDHLYEFTYNKNPFSFKVTRKADNYVLFDSSALSMVLKDQYLQIATAIGSDLSIYGIGETTRDNMRLSKGEKHTLWGRDQAAHAKNVYLYGSHPFYFGINGKGQSHGVLLLNSNGMDVTLEGDKLVYQTIGGILDFHIMVGPSPHEVSSQYTALIGRPKLMPYWSYGFHQCRWRYTSVDHMREVVSKYAEAKIPLDVMWADIDYMSKFYDFTLDPENFAEAEMKKFMSELHGKNQHFVPIIDPGIPDDKNDRAYSQGLELDVFIKDTRGKPYLGQVWPGPTVFPDFFHPNSTDYWTQQLTRMHKSFEYDGLWIDMNELANFCPGSVCQRDPSKECPNPGGVKDIANCCLQCSGDGNKYDNPPFLINNVDSRDPIFNKAISTSSLQYGGIRQYDSHNLYGLTEAIATNAAQEKITGKRTFILSRSTFPGSGVHAAHWTGDNKATWNDLGWSIPQMLNFGLYGIPMVGSDICGFADSSNMELCARWTALGAFYPFSRNHNEYFAEPQETYVWPEVAEAGRKFIGLRYRLLPYFYTLGYQAHVSGAPIARALFYEFPEDVSAQAIDRQFMIGSGLLLTPVLKEKADSVSGYLPAGVWYSIFDYKREESTGKSFTWSGKLNEMPIHVRGGSIIPMHQAALTSAKARETPFEIIVALPKSSDDKATGDLFLDDGEELEGSASTIVSFTATAGAFKSTVTQDKYSGASKSTVAKLIILGVDKKPSLVSAGSFKYDADKQSLEIDLSDARQSIAKDFAVSWN